jgi:hypothetical protein
MGADGARLRWPRLRELAVAARERLHRRLKARVSPGTGTKTREIHRGRGGGSFEFVDSACAELVRWAVVPHHVVADFENGSSTPPARDLAAIRAVLEAAGVIFVDENGEGAGVRLRKTRGR